MFHFIKWDTTKPGLWTLDWTMDWTLDSIMDSIIALDFLIVRGQRLLRGIVTILVLKT